MLRHLAQGDFPETHETFIGTYWGLVSTPCTAEIVESASTYVIVGPLFNDYNTVAFTLLLDESEPQHHTHLLRYKGISMPFSAEVHNKLFAGSDRCLIR